MNTLSHVWPVAAFGAVALVGWGYAIISFITL